MDCLLRKNLVLIIIAIAFFSCKKEDPVDEPVNPIKTITVAPKNTHPDYAATEESHLVLSNTESSINRLLIFIGGSFSKPSSYSTIANHSAEIGFDVINLSYLNNVAAASLADSDDAFTFDNYREELCFGSPVSDAVDVNELNSINNRILNLLLHLKITDAEGNWGSYLQDDNSINWSLITITGHSQGAGHACYFGKKKAVNNVVLFAGPNDYSEYFNAPANWLTETGLTATNKQFVLLHIDDDVVPYEYQLENIRALGIVAPDESTTLVDNLTAPYNNENAFHLNISAISAHSAPIGNSVKLPPLWTYLFLAE